ncbi:hypothetical protein E4U32_001519 [Claviceps aff. humidiphila group G2b]|nr:hypothetical protein E4U32_001519 [Claviceps aff. humidiphila group G2b]
MTLHAVWIDPEMLTTLFWQSYEPSVSATNAYKTVETPHNSARSNDASNFMTSEKQVVTRRTSSQTLHETKRPISMAVP